MTGNSVALENIAVDNLRPHPKNPRLIMRQDVIDGIKLAIQERGEFSAKYALLARPVNDHYEIISGHHRFEAAKAANCDTIPCWIEDMDDDRAEKEMMNCMRFTSSYTSEEKRRWLNSYLKTIGNPPLNEWPESLKRLGLLIGLRYLNFCGVYIVHAENTCFYKIGATKFDLDKRIKSLQTGCPFEITIHHWIAFDPPFKLEKHMHKNAPDGSRRAGEWFELSDDQLKKLIVCGEDFSKENGNG